MKSIEIKGALRKELGKTETKKLRKAEEVPCVLYGSGEVVHFSAPSTAFKSLIYTPDALIVKLNIDGKTHESVLQAAQYHPVSDELLHADFLKVEKNKAVTIDVPVKVVGTSKGVLAGGKLQVNLRKVKVKALPANLPDSVNVDISEVDLGGVLKIKSLVLPEGVEVLNAASSVVVAVKATRTSRAAENAN